MKITPAILTNDIIKMQDYLTMFLEIGSIDIDIIEKDFIDNETIGVEYLLQNDTLALFQDIGWHLMVNDPGNKAEILLNSFFKGKECRLYAQQEVPLESYLVLKFPDNWKKCICIQIESDLKDLEFYNQFDEVQLMSIEIGRQGNKFIPEVLSKVDTLRRMGYNGIVSLDGGINLETAKLLLGHQIDRLSIGSYLSKAEDKTKAYEDLNRVVNPEF